MIPGALQTADCCPLSPALELELQSSSLPDSAMAGVHSRPGGCESDGLPKDGQTAGLPPSHCMCMCVRVCVCTLGSVSEWVSTHKPIA